MTHFMTLSKSQDYIALNRKMTGEKLTGKDFRKGSVA
jgi:hypothetical protein